MTLLSSSTYLFSLCTQIARKALAPPDDPREGDEESELMVKPKPLAGGVPQHWSSVRCACIEGVLSTAILASRHADVWEAAALLLREHCGYASLEGSMKIGKSDCILSEDMRSIYSLLRVVMYGQDLTVDRKLPAEMYFEQGLRHSLTLL